MTPKQDAAAVRRILAGMDKRRAELAELERNLMPLANRLSFANGYRVPLRGMALRNLAEAA